MPVNGLKAGIQPKDIWWKSVGQTRLGNRLTDTLISRMPQGGSFPGRTTDGERLRERIISYLGNLPNVFSMSRLKPAAFLIDDSLPYLPGASQTLTLEMSYTERGLGHSFISPIRLLTYSSDQRG